MESEAECIKVEGKRKGLKEICLPSYLGILYAEVHANGGPRN